VSIFERKEVKNSDDKYLSLGFGLIGGFNLENGNFENGYLEFNLKTRF
jgi:hypothetical protein